MNTKTACLVVSTNSVCISRPVLLELFAVAKHLKKSSTEVTHLPKV